MRALSPRLGGLVLVLLTATSAPAQMTADQQAALLLNGARRAYNEHNYPFATARFREYLARFGGNKDAPAARYGLALCLIEGPDRKLPEAVQLLQSVAGDRNAPDHPYALYYTGHAQRALGVQELAQATAKPQEANQRKAEAVRRFDEAGRSYAAAVEAFTARVKNVDPKAVEVPPEADWAARARCDQAEMLLRAGKAKEAREVVAPFLGDRTLIKSRYRRLALYHHGFASFLLKDNLAAGKSLNQLTPFGDPVFGTHARYLLARVHHLDGERAEAAAHYQGVLTDHARLVKDAGEALKNPQAFKSEPGERERLQALATSPPPDHFARSLLYLGVMQYEDGKFADALARFQEFEKQLPGSRLLPEVRLRIGFCQVQTKAYAEAEKVLRPLADKEPTLADQALLWLGKAQSANADPANAAAFAKAQETALNTLRQAAEKARGDTPELKARRGLILLETSDVQQLAKQYKEAANTCTQILNEKLLPAREDETTQRLAAALHLAGDYAGSDAVCVRFQQTFPKSTLMPAVLFRHAENAAFAALTAENNVNLPDRVNTLKRLNDEAIKRYQLLLDRYPEHAQASLARFGVATGHYRKGDVEKALELFEGIAAGDRVGELAVVPYALADCYLRTAPADAEDALAAGKLTEALTKAVEALGTFIAGSPTAPQTPDALLKLGYCNQRLAEVHAQKEEKAKDLAAARSAYDTLMQKFPNHPLWANAVFERAHVLAQQNDGGGAVNELRRFLGDNKLKAAPVAPMALLRLATLLRAQKRFPEAVEVMDRCRKDHEGTLARDPARAAWVPLLQYHHGLALKDVGKLPEARREFDGVVKNHAAKPEAVEAALRFGQCLKEEGSKKADEAGKLLAQPGRNPQQQAEDRAKRDEGVKLVRDAVVYLEQRAEVLKQQKADSPTRARMLYEAAWAARVLADSEVESARERLRQEQWEKLKAAAARKTPQGQKPPDVPKPEVERSAVPTQEAEKKVASLYRTLLEAFPDLEQNVDTRFELAELLSERGEHDAAIKLLQEAIDKEPSPEMTEKIRLRLGACYAAKGDTKAALRQLQSVASNQKSPLRAQAVYHTGEVALAAKDYAEAEKQLKQFRDFGPFQNLPGLTDRALLRLGHTLGLLKQWDASRQAHEQVANRFGQGPWANEARYGIAWAHQNKGEYDQAVNVYNQVTAATATELGARAQLNIGLCRLAQKKYGDAATALLVVPFTYDYPELSAVALLEAARALDEDKKRGQAVKLLERLLRDHPDSESAKAAKERLDALKKG